MTIDYNLPAPEYHAVDAISSSQLRDVCKGGVYLWKLNQDIPMEESPSMRLGTMMHTLVLESEKADTLVVMPEFSGEGSGTARKEWKVEHADDFVCTQVELEKAQRMLDSLRTVPWAVQCLTGKTEVSAFWEDPETGIKYKVRPDVVGNGWLADLKTCSASDLHKFKYAIRDFDYDVQGAFYLDIWGKVAKLYEHFVFIAVETVKPFAIGTWELSQYDLDIARDKWHVALQQIQDYKATGVMPPNCHTDKVEIISVA